jgi:hypothetical protein
MRRVMRVLGVVAVMLAGGLVGISEAQQQCDFLTAGGYIINDGEKANFAVGGSCKPGGDEHGLWGHLQYTDHGADLNVHWTTITGYFLCNDPSCSDIGPDIASAQPTGTRLICGTARTNRPFPDDTVDWAVTATDKREPGKNNDVFTIRVVSPNSSFTYEAGPRALDGGNIQLHKPNKSTGFFNGEPTPDNCPAFVTANQCAPGETPDPPCGCCGEGVSCDPSAVGGPRCCPGGFCGD